MSHLRFRDFRDFMIFDVFDVFLVFRVFVSEPSVFRLENISLLIIKTAKTAILPF